MDDITIHVIGGLYREQCMRPYWAEVYGSAGRAASAIAALGGKVCLHGYADKLANDTFSQRSVFENFSLALINVPDAVTFHYVHGLAKPTISGALKKYPDLQLSESHVLRFGMLEGDAVVNAEYAVYDPQNVDNPVHFSANGSTAKHLALVLNRYEAKTLSGIDGTALEMAESLAKSCGAEVIIIKLGPHGAFVFEAGAVDEIPAFRTNTVWKIGSGDTFVALFAYYWMRGESASQAAKLASLATAYYCEHQGFPTTSVSPGKPALLSSRVKQGYKPKVYLAGPFFTLSQLWLVEQAREQIASMGLQVFSPYHDVGHATANDVAEKDLAAIDNCDVVFAIADGCDSGTMYEIGHARARNKPVIIYCENEPDHRLKMMKGAGCIIVADYVSAIYQTLWAAIER